MAFPQTPLPYHTGTQYWPGTEDFGFDTPPSAGTTNFTTSTPVGSENFGFDSLPVQHQCGIDSIIQREKDAFGKVNPLSSDTEVPSSDLSNAHGRSQPIFLNSTLTADAVWSWGKRAPYSRDVETFVTLLATSGSSHSAEHAEAGHCMSELVCCTRLQSTYLGLIIHQNWL